MAASKTDTSGKNATGIVNVDDGELLYLKALIYGDPGTGKTRLAGTAAEHPDMNEVYFVNYEGGTLTVRGKGIKGSKRQLHSIEDCENEFWALANKREGYDKVRTVVVDSGTELATVVLEEIIAKACDTDPKRDRDTPYQGDYNKQLLVMRRLMRYFRDLPMHVIVTAHVRRIWPSGDLKTQAVADPLAVRPEFPPRLEQSIAGYFDFIWQLEALTDRGPKNDQPPTTRRFLHMQPKNPQHRIKTRGERFADKLGKGLFDPTLPKIFQLLQLTEGKK